MNTLETEYIFTENLYQIKGKVLVLIPNSWSLQSNQDISLLSRILGSIKLSIDTVQIVSATEISLNELNNYNPSAILAFGVTFTPTIKPYSAEVINGITLIWAEKLADLDEAKKKNLWNALKEGFKL